MPRKIVTLRDKYGSTTRYYPKVLKQCLPEELQDIFPLTKDNFTGTIYFDEWDTNALAPVIEIKKDATHKAQLRVWGNNVLGNDVYGVEMEYQDGNALATVSIDKDGILLSGNNKDININTTGTSKLYINGVEYTGGGKTLYQHNIFFNFGGNLIGRFAFTIVCDIETPFTVSTLATYLQDKGINDDAKCISVSGSCNNTNTSQTWLPWSLYSSQVGSITFKVQLSGNYISQTWDYSSGNLYDTVVAL